MVIFNLKHLAMLQKWPKSQNYQISQCCQIWMWIFSKIAKTAKNYVKMPIFGKNCLKSAKSSHAVPTEHTFTGLPAISAYNPNQQCCYFEYIPSIIQEKFFMNVFDKWILIIKMPLKANIKQVLSTTYFTHMYLLI